MAATAPKKWNWWYERIADWLIANPDKLLRDCAADFKVSQSWLSIIINSDMFQDYWKVRSKEASDAALIGVREKAFAAAEMALDALNERLETQAKVLPITTLLEITEVTMKRFGYGGDKKSPGPTTQNNYFLGQVSKQELADARASMAEVARTRERAEDLVALPAPADGGDDEDGRGVDP